MKNKFMLEIREADMKDYRELKRIALKSYDTSIDPERRYRLVRLLFCRYFSYRKLKARSKLGEWIFVGCENNKVVGFFEMEKNGLLSSLYVLPEKQGCGYGRALLQKALAVARQAKFQYVDLDASCFAQAFYEHFGFRQNGQKKVVLGIAMIPMRLHLCAGKHKNTEFHKKKS